jgi:Protein of unknown function (DUF3616)
LAAQEPSLVEAQTLEHLLDLPTADGCDRAEDITLFKGAKQQRLAQCLVVYDVATPARHKGLHAVLAEVFELPARA